MENFFALKLDHEVSDKNNLSFRWVVDRGVQTDPFVGATQNVGSPGLLALPGVETDPEANWRAQVQDRHIFSANLINVATFGFVRTNQQQELNENNVPSILKVFTPFGDVGSITIGSVATAGFTGTVYVPLQQLQNTFTEQDEVNWIHGAHSFKFGGGVSRIQCNCVQAANAGGVWSFPTLQSLPHGQA